MQANINNTSIVTATAGLSLILAMIEVMVVFIKFRYININIL